VNTLARFTGTASDRALAVADPHPITKTGEEPQYGVV
jgi:hypothetical protein